MSLDAAANFCYGTVTTAPSPATSGTSVVITLLGGCTLPVAPWNAFIWITGVGPLQSNAEIIRCTAFSQVGAVATLSVILRAQESTAARTIVIGDQFAVGPTAKFITDLLATFSLQLTDTGAGNSLIANQATAQVKKLIAGSNITLTPAADGITVASTAPGTGDVVGPASAVDGDLAMFDGVTGKLIKDGGTPSAIIAAATHAASSKATPVDADEIPLSDSAASFVLKKLTWANLKATAKTYFDGLYQPLASILTNLAAGTISSSLTFAENTALILDAVLSADGTYCGITEIVTAGETIAFGDVLYLKAADSQWYLTDADADATAGAVRIAIAVSASTDNNPVTILTYGKIRADAKFPTLTVGAPAYVSTSPGLIQVAQPSGTDDVIRIVGHANTADELMFAPDASWMTHT